MAPPESFDVWVFHLTDILAEEGPPPKFEKNKFVLKGFLSNFKCFCSALGLGQKPSFRFGPKQNTKVPF